LVPYLADSDPEIRAQAAKWLGDVRYRKAGEALIALLRDDYPRARFFAAEALGRTAHEGAIEPLVKLLASNNDEDHYIRHAASLALARIGRPEPVVALHGHTSRAVRLGAVLALRRMKVPGIAAFLKDSDEYIVAEAARAINDDLSIPEALPALGEVLKETRFASEPLLRRAINANLRVGTLPALQLLIDYAQREGAPVAMRAEAVDALSTWAKPSVLDRVDGRYRGEVVRDLSEVQTKAAPALIALMPHAEPSLRQVVVRATGRLQLKEAVPSLLARLKNDRDAGVREAALRALVIMGTDQTEQAVRLALADQSKNVRVAGLDLLPTAGLAPTVVVPLLAGVIAQRTTEEKQAAITTLGTLPVANTEPTFNQLLNRWQQRTLPPEVQLELAEAIEAAKSGELKSRLQSISRGAAADSLQALYAGALLGGDPQRGADIFWGHPTAQCVRCHSFNDYGGTAGPRINGVGARLTRGQLLEALVSPSARIAPGFGVVTLELTGGTRLSGILVEETSQAIRIKRGDRPDSTIARTAIQKRIDSPSSMPPMQYLLTKKELRDVVAFLASLEKEEE
jgi:putative heme-binding domain-containing protein